MSETQAPPAAYMRLLLQRMGHHCLTYAPPPCYVSDALCRTALSIRAQVSSLFTGAGRVCELACRLRDKRLPAYILFYSSGHRYLDGHEAQASSGSSIVNGLAEDRAGPVACGFCSLICTARAQAGGGGADSILRFIVYDGPDAVLVEVHQHGLDALVTFTWTSGQKILELSKNNNFWINQA